MPPFRYIRDIQATLRQNANNDVWNVSDTGVPTTSTGVGMLGRGSTYTDLATGIVYANIGTKAAPSWQQIGASGGIPFTTEKKSLWLYFDDQSSPTVQQFGTTLVAAGTGSSGEDATTSRNRRTTASGDDASAGWRGSTLGDAGEFRHLPTITFDIFTGSDITTLQIWAGLFDNLTQTTAPGVDNNGVLTRVHAAFRYAPAVDTAWVASVADGTTQSTGVMSLIAVSTRYKLKIRFITSTSVAFSINGGTETVVTIATAAGDATRMTWGIWVFNNGAGFTRFLDLVALYEEYR